MSQGSIKTSRSFKRLYLSVACATALRLYPSVLKKTVAVGAWFKNNASLKANASNNYKCMDGAAEMQEYGDKISKLRRNGRTIQSSVAILGKVFEALPSRGGCGCEDFYTLAHNENSAELDMKCMKCSSLGCEICAGRRVVERSRKTGFDLIRATFNLARGNIEDHAFAVYPV